MTWGWQQPDGTRGHETTVELDFEPVADGTRLRLVQRVFASVEQRDGHRMGWTSSLNKLEKAVEAGRLRVTTARAPRTAASGRRW